MAYEIRRKDRKMNEIAALELLKKGEYGIIASVAKDNQPYGVPVSYVVVANSIYFHCALVGHKLDNIMVNDKVSFTVVGQTKPYAKEDDYSTFYESVIVFGKAKVVEETNEIVEALKKLCEKYFPDDMDNFQAIYNHGKAATKVVKISIDYLSGKANIEK